MDTSIDARSLAPTNDNRWGAHFRATLALGIPLIGAQLAQLGIHTTDVMIIGRLGAEQLAAMVLSAQFLFTILIFGSGFSIAVIPMVAQAYGRGDVVSVRRSLRMGLWVVIGFWIIAQPAFFNAEQILLFAQQKPEVARLAHAYILIGQFGVLPALLFNVLRALVSAIGKAGIILNVTIVTLVMNAIFAYALVLGHFGLPAMGLEGAAIVSVVVQTAGFLFILVFVQRREETRRYEIFVRFWKPDWHALLEVIRLGFPISVTVLAEVSLFTVASLLMGYIGTIELAAHGIALQWASIAFMIPLGLSQAATVRIGVAHGQGDYDGLVRASIMVVIIACAISAVGSVIFATMPQFLGSWFLDVSSPEAPEVLAYAGPLIVVAGLFQLVDGLQVIANGLLRGLKDARVPMIMALIAYWPIGFFLAWAFAFPLGFGGIGIWFGFLVGLAAAATMLCGRFYLLLRREGAAAGA
ncbi:MATE family efflux transporter [Rhizobium bangladeshense]|uniref:MATE family efflux transporter n=1 Tax=Rhizobium bangladeshense TaxID=1138189 RepID=UPI001C82AEDD|nr:MATE family efflux transporter [Rhizobium bangladeshense]MBX4866722.1 MATE family efflux transporter [Rhizobium bangladeshense]MBX4894372.1 MATE family efflux transporter [Rhizobium bangladeshense]MBX4919100.1 MATE family efflux transporter [Rhizobium bangladeshense]MBY3611928.1 MATE family efflux transporter [Rhizobium bangladeshense]